MKKSHSRKGAPPRHVGSRQFPRTARVNEVLREVLAEELEEVAGSDPRLGLITVTGVECDPDLRHATVLLASMSGPAQAALEEARTRLQSAIGRQVRLKRTPHLTFEVDPAITHGQRVEEILRGLHAAGQPGPPAGTAPAE